MVSEGGRGGERAVQEGGQGRAMRTVWAEGRTARPRSVVSPRRAQGRRRGSSEEAPSARYSLSGRCSLLVLQTATAWPLVAAREPFGAERRRVLHPTCAVRGRALILIAGHAVLLHRSRTRA
jgi:hypothetical protein